MKALAVLVLFQSGYVLNSSSASFIALLKQFGSAMSNAV